MHFKMDVVINYFYLTCPRPSIYRVTMDPILPWPDTMFGIKFDSDADNSLFLHTVGSCGLIGGFVTLLTSISASMFICDSCDGCGT